MPDLSGDLGRVLVVRGMAGQRVHGKLRVRNLAVQQPLILDREEVVVIAGDDEGRAGAADRAGCSGRSGRP